MSSNLESEERESFLHMLQALTAPGGAFPEFFTSARRVGVARAPGRLDLMGGIADYSGSLVLQWPTREAAWAAVQVHPEPELRVLSLDPDSPQQAPREAHLKIEPLLVGSVAQVGEWFRNSESPWAAYVAGALALLPDEQKRQLQGRGLRIVLSSRVPEGKGVSSSAAIEVAALFALAASLSWPLDPREAALLCQSVENGVVGAPCGAMDQLTSACGERGRLLELLCQPATLLGTLPLPRDLAVFGIDSGERHAVSGPSYGRVRAGAFMGYHMLAALRSLKVREVESLRQRRVTDERWGGYLANVSLSEFEEHFEHSLPRTMSGADFLAQYAGPFDPVSVVRPDESYPVRAATRHPVREHLRVQLFAELLRSDGGERSRRLMGELMYQSHVSYSACGLGAPGTDRLVALVREAGPEQGLFGAKVSGGGCGGTVVILAKPQAESAVRRIAERYATETGYAPVVFSGSSAGAAEFGSFCIGQ